MGSGPISGTAGTLSYDALVDFWSQFAPYALNTLVVGDAMADILKLKEMQDGTAGLTFQGTGKLVTPMGATLVRSSAVPGGDDPGPGQELCAGAGASQRRAGGV